MRNFVVRIVQLDSDSMIIEAIIEASEMWLNVQERLLVYDAVMNVALVILESPFLGGSHLFIR